MSEYEYYEFQAIDRPLSAEDLRALRAISSRATITPTHFSNFYTFGSLKANPLDLLAKYFDVFVYVANGRYREVAFRFLKASFDAKVARLYASANALAVQRHGDYDLVVVSAECFDDETGGEDDDGRGWLSTLARLRADLAVDDHRALYLAWLMGVHAGNIDDDTVEPPCPSGLKELSGPLETFVDFVWLDTDLVTAAAESSASVEPISSEDLERWVASLGDMEKTQLLVRVARQDEGVAAELVRRSRRTTTGHPATRRRRVGELRAAAARLADQRRRAEHERAAVAEQRRKAVEQRARDERLTSLATRQDAIWRQVEELVDSRKSASYGRAVALLCDLRDIGERAGRRDDFERRLKDLREKHRAKSAFLRQLLASKA